MAELSHDLQRDRARVLSSFHRAICLWVMGDPNWTKGHSLLEKHHFQDTNNVRKCRCSPHMIVFVHKQCTQRLMPPKCQKTTTQPQTAWPKLIAPGQASCFGGLLQVETNTLPWFHVHIYHIPCVLSTLPLCWKRNYVKSYLDWWNIRTATWLYKLWYPATT